MNKQKQNHWLRTDSRRSHGREGGGCGLRLIFLAKIIALDSSVVKYTKLTSARLEASLLMQCIITGKQPNQLTYFVETKKSALNSQTVKARENWMGPVIDKHQSVTQ